MRLVAWNANFNNHRKRSFEETVALMERFHADILVLSETAVPQAIPKRVVPLAASSPALVVVAKGAYTIDQLRTGERSPPQSGCFEVRCGAINFILAAIWPVQSKDGPNYHRILGDIFDHFRDGLSRHPVIAAGDFNSNTRVKAQRTSHPKLVKAIEKAGLASAYHHHADVNHGSEIIPTYVQGKTRPQPFHIDYCFVSTSLSDAATVTVPQAKVWKKHSDHFPLVLDIPDSAILAADR